MNPELKQAACLGDVGFLKRAVASKPTDFFLSQYSPDEGDMKGNIFHLALWNDKIDFVKEAMNLLDKDLVYQLLSQQEEDGWNPLHAAANRKKCLEPVKLILDFFRSFPDTIRELGKEKPWLALSTFNSSPLHIAMNDAGEESMDDEEEECALELLLMDMEAQCTMVDDDGNSPLILAVKNGFSRVAEKILTSEFSYSLSGKEGSTPLHFAPKCSETVLRLLLEKHPNLIDEGKVDDIGFNILHQWADLKEIWPFNLVLNGSFPFATKKIFGDLIFSKAEKKRGDTPLHTAARTGNPEIGRVLVCGYQQENVSLDCPPWKIQNKNGDTPLHVALWNNNPELALYFLSIDPTLCHIQNNRGDSPLLVAVGNGKACKQVVKEILKIQDIHHSYLRRNDGTTVLHWLRYCPEEIGKELLGKFWWLMNMRDDKGKTALDYAKTSNVPWMVSLLTQPILIEKEPFDWIRACDRQENWAVSAFVESCHDLQKICRDRQDTPLHHIKFKTHSECSKFLKMGPIAELKNATDSDGATPLYRALEREDKILAKALLTDDGVERNPKHMDLLSKLCTDNDEWELMCKQIKVNPHLKTTYIQSRTNLDQMRNTLSVVAALLATITFAAGFTLPGGLNSETGNALLAKKASFIVFLIADAYAMCTSILVLFCLIWSMVSNNDMSHLLVDRSVLVLMQSLYGTMVAFMTGIYTVIEQSTLWVAIVIFVMCSLIGISVNRTVLHSILATLIPTANKDHKNRSPSRKRESPSTSGNNDESKSLHETNSNQNQDHNDDDQLVLLEEGKASTSGKKVL